MQLFPGAQPSLPAFTFLLLMSFLERCFKTTEALSSNSSYPSYEIVHLNSDIAHLQTNFYPLSASDPYPYKDIPPSGTLNITWLNSTTTTISIRWGLSSKLNQTGYVRDSTVEYFPADGKFTSHPLSSYIREFTFTNLNTGMLYTICVHMNEMYGFGNSSTYRHSKCVKIHTIDHVRQDSVLFLVLSLGYYAFMALLGYSQWKKKQILLRARNRKRAGVDTTMRWKDLAEKENLVANPNCSIEYSETT